MKEPTRYIAEIHEIEPERPKGDSDGGGTLAGIIVGGGLGALVGGVPGAIVGGLIGGACGTASDAPKQKK